MSLSDSTPPHTGTPADFDQYDGYPQRNDEGGQRDRYSWVLLAVPGALGVWDGLDLGVGTLSQPAGGMWMVGLGVVLLVFAAIVAVQGHRFQAPAIDGLARVSCMIAALASFPIVYSFAGFIVAGFVMLLIIIKLAAQEAWWISLALAALAPAIVFALFALTLGVNLRLI